MRPSSDRAAERGPGRLEVIECGVTVGDDGTVYPTVVLDVTDRPDVADLPRVHAIEGIGDLTTAVELDDDGLDLVVRLTRPVSAGFTIRFLLPEHEAVLAEAAEAGHLLLATTSPAAEPSTGNPTWLAIDLDGPRLTAVLAAADR